MCMLLCCYYDITVYIRMFTLQNKTSLCSYLGHVLKPETPKRNRRNETTGTTETTGTAGTTETKPPKPPEQPKRNRRNHRNNRNETTGTTETKPPKPPKRGYRNNRTTCKTRRREPQKVPKVITQTVSITETYVSPTNHGRSTGMDNLGAQRSPGY